MERHDQPGTLDNETFTLTDLQARDARALI